MGTAYFASSQIWFTLWNGIITEVYYPNLDRPRLRDPPTNDEWHTVRDTLSATTTPGGEFVDIPITAGQRTPIRFTFFRLKSNSWEGRDDLVEARP